MEEREKRDAAREARRDAMARSPGSAWREEVLCRYLAAAAYDGKDEARRTPARTATAEDVRAEAGADGGRPR